MRLNWTALPSTSRSFFRSANSLLRLLWRDEAQISTPDSPLVELVAAVVEADSVVACHMAALVADDHHLVDGPAIARVGSVVLHDHYPGPRLQASPALVGAEADTEADLPGRSRHARARVLQRGDLGSMPAVDSFLGVEAPFATTDELMTEYDRCSLSPH